MQCSVAPAVKLVASPLRSSLFLEQPGPWNSSHKQLCPVPAHRSSAAEGASWDAHGQDGRGP
eukprot:362835-Chlamydomonas_euryale.AAC.5